ncbi:MAG: hypothetical protein II874_11175 [Bacteroidales bacterium]|nr:hypothetical protein [Bacteroidales bacterium]
MKIKLILVCSLIVLCGTASAQSRDIGLQVGLNVPMSQKAMIGSDVMLGVSYGQFYHNGLGFRTGFQYAASTADIDDVFGIPLAFAYRTRTKSPGERFETGAAGARDAMIYRGTHRSDAVGFLGGFLLNLFSDMEFFAGATPGYIVGSSEIPSHFLRGNLSPYWEDAWVEKTHDFSLTLDAGVTLNYSIWRFDLKLTPAVHYNLTDNYLYHLTVGDAGGAVKETTAPIRWFFTLNGGLSFRF